MKVYYVDTPKNYDIYVEDNPYCKVRVVFEDHKQTYVYYTDDINNTAYINSVDNVKHKPHMFFISNFSEIKLEEQFNYYYDTINNRYNFQGLHSGEIVEGSEGHWSPKFLVPTDTSNEGTE